jgi:PAS domain S-box-containing protein
MPMVVTDPCQVDNPIVLGNQAFLDLVGYSANEVSGRNCQFLQGPATDLACIARLAKAVAAEQKAEVELLNYRKDGSALEQGLRVAVLNEDGRLQYYFASQKGMTLGRTSSKITPPEAGV